MAVTLPTGRTFTIDDLDRFPDDSNRYELIDGSLHVSPSPLVVHQQVLANLFRRLDAACPPELNVLFAPLDVVFGPATLLIPDLVVLPTDSDAVHRIMDPPALVVEVLSPSTRTYDLTAKRQVYEQAGVGAYWVVDPSVPSITSWTWAGPTPVEASAEGDQPLELDHPFPVTITPADLLARR